MVAVSLEKTPRKFLLICLIPAVLCISIAIFLLSISEECNKNLDHTTPCLASFKTAK
jgi:hypothetical protein